MNNRELLLAGIDILFAMLVVFIVGFFAVRYDEQRGNDAGIVSVENLDAATVGDYQTLRFLGLCLAGDSLELREYAFGQWTSRGVKLRWDWREVLENELSKNDLPVVIYELAESPRFGDLVRQVSTSGHPVGIARLPRLESVQ